MLRPETKQHLWMAGIFKTFDANFRNKLANGYRADRAGGLASLARLGHRGKGVRK